MSIAEPYKSLSLKVLGSFQLLEFSLKLYIATAYKVIQEELNGKIPFNYSYPDIKNYPLERLINLFAKLNDNEDLSTRLNKLRDKRNKVAHTSLLCVYDVFREILGEDIHENYADLSATEGEVDHCLGLIAGEMLKKFPSMENGLA